MGFGWLKTVGKFALAGVKLAGPALPGGGFIAKLLPFAVKGLTGLHTIPGIEKHLPSLTPGQYASIEHAILGVGARVLPGFMVGMYFQNDDFRAGFNQCIAATVAVFTGWLP